MSDEEGRNLAARVTALELAVLDLERTHLPPPPQRPIDGWDAIASEVGLSRSAAQRQAAAHDDPLPVFLYLGRILAYPGALREWRQRHTIPLSTARGMKRLAMPHRKK